VMKLGLSLMLALCLAACSPSAILPDTEHEAPAMVVLPDPRLSGDVSVEEALTARRSVREYAPEPITLEEASQLLWAAQGVTADWGGRTAPSAGALYPLEVYVLSLAVDGLPAGVYRYIPNGHQLALISAGDIPAALKRACPGQPWTGDAAVVLAIAAVYERTTGKYGERGVRYVHMEAGHAAQNVCLQAVALGLGVVTVGAFEDDAVAELLRCGEQETPIYLLPLGRLPADGR